MLLIYFFAISRNVNIYILGLIIIKNNFLKSITMDFKFTFSHFADDFIQSDLQLGNT